MTKKKKQHLKQQEKNNHVRIGGQAVINGVMLRSKDRYVVGVLREDKKLVFYEKEIRRSRLLRVMSSLPFIRGIFALIDSLVIGLDSLNFSSSVFEQTKQDNKKKTETETKHQTKEANVFGIIISLLIAIFVAILLFKYIPIYTVSLIQNKVKMNSFVFSLIEGLVRIIVFIIYLLLISLFKDIRTSFAYHGAEHAVVNAYESLGRLPTLRELVKFRNRTQHNRCGTTYLILVLIIAILIFSLVPVRYSILSKIAARIVLLPLIAMLSYEMMMLYDAMKSRRSIAARAMAYLFAPFIELGLFLQSLTTRKPNKEQLNVALEVARKLLS